MSGSAWAGLAFAVSIAIAIAFAFRPLGDYMARIFTSTRHTRAELAVYRVAGIDPDADQTWGTYLRSVLAFSGVSVLALFGLLRVQHHVGHPYAVPAMPSAQSFNTAVSFVTNTNWQSYSGESALGYVAQAGGLAVQNFLSAAVGIVVAVALVRGFSRSRTDRIGNFWVDLTRCTFRLLVPISFLVAIVFMGSGMIQNWHHYAASLGLAGDAQSIPGGPVASQEAIKQLGTNGGGFFNANSAHPFEGATAWTNWISVFLEIVIPFALCRTFGKMVGDKRQGLAIAAVMGILLVGSTAVLAGAQIAHHGTVPVSVGAAAEGTETRFGVPDSAVFASTTTATSTGAVDSFHDSYTSIAGMMNLFNMMLGEVAPGGTGSGLYGMLVLAVLSVFIAGLMVGRTPEYLGKKIARREITFSSLYVLTTPAVVLIGTALAMSFPKERASMWNTGSHGFSEVLYAFTSAGNNNGSAFAGIAVNTTWYNTALGLAMLFGRFLPMIFVLGLAGSLARQQPVPASEGTLPTHRLQFIGFLTGVTLIVVSLTYFPALALGPLAEGLH